MRQTITLAVAGFALLACEPAGLPTAPVDSPSFIINDAAHLGMNDHFYFLPPMVPQPSVIGNFDSSISPEVQVCQLTPTDCTPVLATFTLNTGPGSETVRVVPEDEHYIVNWHTDQFDLNQESHYRIRIFAEGQELGFADVDVVNSGKELKNVDTGQFIPLKDGRTLPIKFRIEEGAVFRIPPIVFASNLDGDFDLYAMNLDGTGLIKVTDNGWNDIEPAWSPDGTRLAFRSDRNGNDEIYVMDPDGSGLLNLTDHPAADADPTWSPDGTQILFHSARGDVNRPDGIPVSVIFVVNPDGTGLTRITPLNGEDGSADWSPDGTQIVYTSTQDKTWPWKDLWIMNSDGSERTRITYQDNTTDVGYPVWSRFDNKIYFATNRPGVPLPNGLWRINPDGLEFEQLLPRATQPVALSPDGTQLIVGGYGEGSSNFDLVLMPVDGSSTDRLTDWPGQEWWPTWRH